jgi:hypothetical protein
MREVAQMGKSNEGVHRNQNLLAFCIPHKIDGGRKLFGTEAVIG